ncbi:Actin-binding LIM protein 1 [Temnothorax longispinosus]|uniref:Actin-binding LIM protein 1 n=1 Tax=Temnothorax longispinosus TaxID=300112 RepID=A0A4S2KHU4_9HYME|nr:Actin-binding LIM protein 1 [Temnothorax longispinosus]
MKSKTSASESLIASESRAGIMKDGVDQHKQKPLKKGKDRMLAAARKDKRAYFEDMAAEAEEAANKGDIKICGMWNYKDMVAKGHISNEDLWKATNQKYINNEIRKRKYEWGTH